MPNHLFVMVLGELTGLGRVFIKYYIGVQIISDMRNIHKSMCVSETMLSG